MAGLRASALVLLALVSLASCQPPGSSVVCRTVFKVLWIFKATHTWISHSQPCLAPACQYSGPAAWPNVGFEASNRKPLGPGGLRNETYTCSDPSPSSQVSTSCARGAIAYLERQGWNGGWKSPYVITAGAKNCAGVNAAGQCSPSRTGNVCWSFTCNFQDCAVYKLAQSACPEKDPLAPGQSPPAAWRCPASAWNDGKICHCDCGEWDPDCWDQARPTGGCSSAELCTFPGVCSDRNRTLTDRKLLRAQDDGEDVWAFDYVPKFGHYEARRGAELRAPSDWTCPPEYYGSNDGCDSDMHLYMGPSYEGLCGPSRDPDCEPKEEQQGWFLVDAFVSLLTGN